MWKKKLARLKETLLFSGYSPFNANMKPSMNTSAANRTSTHAKKERKEKLDLNFKPIPARNFGGFRPTCQRRFNLNCFHGTACLPYVVSAKPGFVAAYRGPHAPARKHVGVPWNTSLEVAGESTDMSHPRVPYIPRFFFTPSTCISYSRHRGATAWQTDAIL